MIERGGEPKYEDIVKYEHIQGSICISGMIVASLRGQLPGQFQVSGIQEDPWIFQTGLFW
jgi:hypothetical protein